MYIEPKKYPNVNQFVIENAELLSDELSQIALAQVFYFKLLKLKDANIAPFNQFEVKQIKDIKYMNGKEAIDKYHRMNNINTDGIFNDKHSYYHIKNNQVNSFNLDDLETILNANHYLSTKLKV